ncbi:MAG: RNA polymerase II mediator complex subunit [Chaenotheca gracillima]|nr:MAG: RNA polymerase II mediator complex subunit [Chaenotheca gracillima]
MASSNPETGPNGQPPGQGNNLARFLIDPKGAGGEPRPSAAAANASHPSTPVMAGASVSQQQKQANGDHQLSSTLLLNSKRSCSLAFESPSRSSSEPRHFAPVFDFDAAAIQNDRAHFYLNCEGQPRRDKASSVVNGDKPPSNGPRFDPRALLNPKSFARAPTTQKNNAGTAKGPEGGLLAKEKEPQPKVQANDSTQQGQDPEDRNAAYGMGSYIERMYGVSERDGRPQKRRKTEQQTEDEDAEKKKAIFNGGGKGGDIGAFLKEQRDEASKEARQKGSIVDLTQGDDDDDVVVISDTSQREVCYGRIGSCAVLAFQVPAPSPTARGLDDSYWPVIKVDLRRTPAKSAIISVIDPMGNDFGSVSTLSALALSPVMDRQVPGVRFQARIPSRPKKPYEYPGSPMSGPYDLHINVYGPRNMAERIGRWISQKQVWFRAPSGVDAGVEVANPHADKAPVISRTSLISNGPGSGVAMRTVEEVRNDVMTMFDSLQKSSNLPEMEPNDLITTPLLGHQKQALHFMTEKEKPRVFGSKDEENNSLWRSKIRSNGQRVFTNVISDTEERRSPPEVYGGILADMMGLGKTLSILSLITHSMEESKSWSRHGPSTPRNPDALPLLCNSKATLLVCPLSTVANWEEQIHTHVKPKSIAYHIYHGNNRCESIDALASFDLVITTYSVVSSELSRRSKKIKNAGVSLLEQTNWFRIVLDEAHMIREQSTRQSQAICSLSAQRRWAVTGTPVQNRLDDLGALLKFLQLKPFDTKGGFSQFILSPFKQGDPEVPLKLRVLVDSVTLRRLKDKIDLPPRKDQIVRLQFSDDERNMHEIFLRDSQLKIGVIAGEKRKSLGGKSYVHVLRAILRLRLICAHGKELLGDDDLKILEGHTASNAINLDDDDAEKPGLDAKQAYDMFHLMKETNADKCNLCDTRMGTRDGVADDAGGTKEDIVGYLAPCFQLICKDCIRTYKEALEPNPEDPSHAQCPLCRQHIRISFFELRQSKIDDDEDARTEARDNPRAVKKLGKYGGPHTKTRALLENLEQSRLESESLPKDKPIKSVVFSGWTSHLDLIQIALEDNNIRYVRLDGKMSRPQRTTSLDVFRDDPEVLVILVSITAGGLGLNLTTASKVFVMEPQFNPAAEAQAVDRVHRLGQTREVTTTRFIMDNSFEQKILDLQDKKTKLAEMAVHSKGGRGIERGEASKRKMEELRSMFK